MAGNQWVADQPVFTHRVGALIHASCCFSSVFSVPLWFNCGFKDKQAPIGKAGQGVVVRHVPQLLLQALFIRDIPHRAQHALRFACCVTGGPPAFLHMADFAVRPDDAMADLIFPLTQSHIDCRLDLDAVIRVDGLHEGGMG